MKPILSFVAALLTAVGLVQADLGDLNPVAVPPNQAMMARPLMAQGNNFAKCRAGDGTVNKHAIVATFKSGPFVIKAAIDSRSPDAPVSDLVRFDFTGKGRFDDKLVVPLKMNRSRRGSSENGTFGPATLDVRRNGRTVPVTVRGRYHKQPSFRYMQISLGSGVEGICAFGDKKYTVRIIDGNSNLRVGDPVKRGGRGRRAGGVMAGDTVVVDVGQGDFKNRDKTRRCLFGQPVLVDDTWYKVALSPNRSKVLAAPLGVRTGMIKIAHERWSATLVGKKFVLSLTGNAAPIAVPSDLYRITNYREFALGDGRGPRGVLGCSGNRELATRKGKVFKVVAGRTNEITIGSPLTASIRAAQQGRQVNLSLNLVDASGATVDELSGPKGRPPPPAIEILDARGVTVHTGKLEYG